MTTPTAVVAEVKKELREFADNRGISYYDICVRSVTTSADAAPKNDLPDRAAALQKMDRDARILGTLRHLVSVYVNALADDPEASATGCELIFDGTFLSQLFVFLCDGKLRKENKKAPRRIDAEYFAVVKAHLFQFIRDLVDTLPQELIAELRTFPRGPICYLAQEMLTPMKWDVRGQYEETVPRYLQCLVESVLWGQRQYPHFGKLIKSVSVAMLRACVMPTEEEAVGCIQGLCDAPDMRDWEGPLTAVLLEYCVLFEDCVQAVLAAFLPSYLF